MSSVAKSLSSTSTWLPGERAHERRLAGVGVADERDAELVLARVAAVLLLLLDRGELLAELGDAVADLPAIELDRGLAGALAALPLLAAGRLAHARRHVVEARDLDLQARLAAPRVAVEDVDDDAGAVEHLRRRSRARGCAPGSG